MTPKQVTLVQGTSDVLLTVEPHVANCFYDRLFELAPETKSLFAADLSHQKAKLTNMLASLIGALGRPELFASIITYTGRTHARLGILPKYYEPTGQALIAAMAASLGPRFTPEVREAWAALYLAIQIRMLEAGSA